MVDYGAVDLYWGRCGRIWRCRSFLGRCGRECRCRSLQGTFGKGMGRQISTGDRMVGYGVVDPYWGRC